VPSHVIQENISAYYPEVHFNTDQTVSGIKKVITTDDVSVSL